MQHHSDEKYIDINRIRTCDPNNDGMNWILKSSSSNPLENATIGRKDDFVSTNDNNENPIINNIRINLNSYLDTDDYTRAAMCQFSTYKSQGGPLNEEEFFQNLANNGNEVGFCGLGYLYKSGLYGTEKNLAKAALWYSKAAHEGIYEGINCFLRIIYRIDGYDKDYSEAVNNIIDAAEIGYPYCQYILGKMYELGHGVNINSKEAVKWYRILTDRGIDEGKEALGNMYYKGEGVEQNFEEAFKLYKAAHCNIKIGDMYYKGQGVNQNYEEAFKCFIKANKHFTNTFACFRLGEMYFYGKGVEIDYKKAAEWYLKVIKNSNLYKNEEQWQNFLKHLTKEKVPRYKERADMGDKECQYVMGYLYQHGYEVDQNYAKAAKYYRLAIEK